MPEEQNLELARCWSGSLWSEGGFYSLDLVPPFWRLGEHLGGGES
jgi:hypothetical protein